LDRLVTTAFLQTMLNPDGAFLSTFESTNMVLLSLFAVAYCVFCVLVWFSLNRLAQKREPDLLHKNSCKNKFRVSSAVGLLTARSTTAREL
jgi:hypothetical protein